MRKMRKSKRKTQSKQLPVRDGKVRTSSGKWRTANQKASRSRTTKSGVWRKQKKVVRGKVRVGSRKLVANQKQNYVKKTRRKSTTRRRKR